MAGRKTGEVKNNAPEEKTAHTAREGEVTPEQVGVLKLLKLAVETEKFMKALEAEGRDKYTIGEYHEKVYAPVMNL